VITHRLRCRTESAPYNLVVPRAELLSVLDLFSGIGGFSLGLERTGRFRTDLFCESDPYCQRVLKKHWPSVPCQGDVRTLTGTLNQFDVVVGGWPCVDLSFIRRGRGLHGAHSGLWNEFKRLVSQIRPRYVLFENVAALRSRGLEDVLRSFNSLGYDVEWDCVPASAVGAPHRRDRLWALAYPTGQRNARQDIAARLQIQPVSGTEAGVGTPRLVLKSDHWTVEPDVARVAYGLSAGLARRSLGNAVVPQVVELVMAPKIIQMEDSRLAAEDQAREYAVPLANLSRSMEVLARHLPGRASFRQGLAFLLVAQAHAEHRNFRVSDLIPHGFGDGVRRSYLMLLAPSLREPDGLDWVWTESDPRDRRQSFLRLTPRGVAVLAELLAE
jgi:DNA (cytosine-5)-methyltransferase 1